MRNASIRLKITLVVAGFFALLAVAQIVGLRAISTSSTDVFMESTLETSRRTFEGLESESLSKLGATLDALIDRDDFRDLYLAGDREALFDYARPLFEELREEHLITHWYFIRPEPESTVFVRIHNDEKYDDVVERITFRQAVETGEYGEGKELGQTAFALRLVKPYRSESGELIGYMELGQEIDSFLDRMKQQTGTEFVLFAEKEHLDRESWASMRDAYGLDDDWGEHPDVVTVDSTLSDEALIRYEGRFLDDLPDEGRVIDRMLRDGRVYIRGIFPISDASGRQVGGVLVIRDITDAEDSVAAARNVLLGAGAAFTVALALLMSLMLDRLVFRRLSGVMAHMEEASVRVLGGDFDVTAGLEPGSRDEIGRFEEFFGRFLSTIASALRALQRRD